MKKAIIILFLLTIFPAFGYTQEEGLSMAMSPLLRKITINPGESWSGVVEVYNKNNVDIEVSAVVINFR